VTGLRILLMAGGSGTRLWPLSTEERPKQFHPILSDKSLLAETWDRVAPLSADVWAATSERHVDLLRRELPALPASHVLAEPARRNSGPALLAAAVRFRADGDPVTASIPSDQTVSDDLMDDRALGARNYSCGFRSNACSAGGTSTTSKLSGVWSCRWSVQLSC